MLDSSKINNFSYIHELAYQLKVKDAMTSPVLTINPNCTMRDARNILRDKRISGLPVVLDDKVVGIISVEDIITALDENDIDAVITKRMNKNVKSLDPNYPLIKALNIFEEYSYGRYPVIDNHGKLLGIMTSGDITRRMLFELNKIVDTAEEKESIRMANHSLKESKGDLFHLECQIKAGDYDNAGVLSSQLKDRLQELGIAPDIIRRAAIAAYEAETNIIIHSVGGILSAWIENNTIHIKAGDKGPGIADIDQAMKPGFSTAGDQIRALGFGAGMGLPNIKKCADGFHIKSNSGSGTELYITIKIHPVSSIQDKRN